MDAVEIGLDAVDQVAALPEKALVPFAEVVSLVEIAPWSGAAHNRERPEVGMRTLTFGENAPAWRSTRSSRAGGGSWSCG